jgi:predicted ATPase
MNGQLGFAQLVLENWKNFVRVDATLRHRVFIVGTNASGKSNFLDALRFLRDLASPGGGLRESVRKRGRVSCLRCLTARRYPDITVRATVRSENGPTWTYEITFNQDNLRRPLVRKEQVEKDGMVLCSCPDEQDQKDLERLTKPTWSRSI